MTILSYRGPCSPGGVSGAIARVFETHSSVGERWWHLSDNRLMARQMQSLKPFSIIPSQIVEGHYRYCNNFLWPVLHNMPDYASFAADDRQFYQQFNLAFGMNVLNEERLCASGNLFVQDYQLALTPSILSHDLGGEKTSVFWHIPWPKSVRQEHIPMLTEVAAGLLPARKIGFHIPEYAENFMRFVEAYLPDYTVDFEKQTISEMSGPDILHRQLTRIIVQPLGVDLQFWKGELERAEHERTTSILNECLSEQFVLSVDRADYTKGVLERLRAINQFFAMYPEWRQKISFVQVCQRSRQGLDAFDRYWDSCIGLAAEVNSRWAQEGWKPVIWVSDPVSPKVLADLYQKARAMLVTPLRDGLNLTAKEYVACAGKTGGPLILSDGAGVWHEFREQAVRVGSQNAQQLAADILTGLMLPLSDRQDRICKMKDKLQVNSLAAWWQRFAGTPARSEPIETGQPPKPQIVSRELTVVGR